MLYWVCSCTLTHSHVTYSMKSTLRCISKVKFLFSLHLHPHVLFLEYGAWLCVTSASNTWYTRVCRYTLTHNHATYSMKSTLRCISEIKFLFNSHLHLSVLFVEYDDDYVLQVLLLPFIEWDFSMWFQPLQTLPSPTLDVVPGALLTAANIGDKFHPIKVEEKIVCGNFHLVGNFFWAHTIF
jgi:hypothetical protein